MEQPFLELDYRILIIIISIFAFVSLFLSTHKEENSKVRILKYVFFGLSILLLIFATNLTELIHKKRLYWNLRIAFYGYVTFILFMISLVLKSQNRIIQNTAALCILALLAISTMQNLYLQRNWKIAYEIETNAINRIITRIEDNAHFNPAQEYICYNAGNFPSEILQRYHGTKDENFLYQEVRAISWWPEQIINYLNPLIKINILWDNSVRLQHISLETKEKIKKALMTAQPWPHKSSVQIIDNVILVIFSQQGLEEEKKEFGIASR